MERMQRKPVLARAVRGRPIELKDWWLSAIKRRAEGKSEAELAAMASATARRIPPWHGTTVGNFLRNEHATEELMLAFSVLFGVPPQVIYPRSYEEADQLWKLRSSFDRDFEERERRRRESDSVTSALELRDRFAPVVVDSHDGHKRTSETDDEAGSADRGAQPRKPRRRPRGVGSGR